MTNLHFWMMFTTDIVGPARAPEEPHNICLSETMAQIMKFLIRDLNCFNKLWFSPTCTSSTLSQLTNLKEKVE